MYFHYFGIKSVMVAKVEREGPMSAEFLSHITDTLHAIDAKGLMKIERPLQSAQGGEIQVGDATKINLCANNYLGLADHPALIDAAKGAMDPLGLGMASVRFICGTQDLHRTLEQRIARFLGKDDSILFAACFDANGGLFEPLLGPKDAIISDALNHASIIDGIRLCKAEKHRYAHKDVAGEREECVKGEGQYKWQVSVWGR